MQERHQIVELLLIKDNVERRHVAAAGHDRVADVLVCSRHAAGESLLSEHPDKRRSL